jgi:hypothetical protein
MTVFHCNDIWGHLNYIFTCCQLKRITHGPLDFFNFRSHGITKHFFVKNY